MEVGSIEVIKRLVQFGFGVSIVPLVSVQDELQRGILNAVRVFSKRDARRLGAVHVRKRHLPLAAKELLRILTECLPPGRRETSSAGRD
jgi:DNA-binding transcriptional LysR family regulator